ncbi:MAG: aminotransferase class III-fold pyridoxal phosphate-dependent enzyme [Terriglobales bacterium]
MNATYANTPMVSNNAAELAYGISAWPDTDEIYARLAALVKQPIRPIRRENMEKVLKYFEERCVQSRQLSERAERVIPGGVQHNLAFNYPFPLAITGANGAYLTDVDGNRYIDFLKAGGPTLLASNDTTVRQQVHALLDSCGAITGLLHEYEVKLAELVCEAMPAVEMFRMLGSGTEAVMAALRLARAYTGRKWVIKIGGAYHGWSDQMVYGMRIPGTGTIWMLCGEPSGSTASGAERLPLSLSHWGRKVVCDPSIAISTGIFGNSATSLAYS